MPALFPLEVIGAGAVSPAGCGVEFLLQPAALEVAPMPSLRPGAKHAYPTFRVPTAAAPLVRWSREPRLRRASPVSHFLVEAATQALAGHDRAALGRLGIATAFFTGAPAYSRRFFQGVLERGQGAASPALFPETVYNSPLSHTAAVLGVEGAAYALVGDESAWVEAMRTAAVWLARDEVDTVLVLAAEELDIVCVEAYAVAGWFRHSPNPFIPAEGAAALLVRRPQGEAPRQIRALAPTCSYRDRKGAERAARKCLANFDPALPVAPTAQGTWLDAIERDATADRPHLAPGPSLGQAFVASAGWHTLRALFGPGTGEVLVPVFGQNQAISALQLRAA